MPKYRIEMFESGWSTKSGFLETDATTREDVLDAEHATEVDYEVTHGDSDEFHYSVFLVKADGTEVELDDDDVVVEGVVVEGVVVEGEVA